MNNLTAPERRFLRVPVEMSIRLSTIDPEPDPRTGRPFFRASREVCANLSEGGAYIRTGEPLNETEAVAYSTLTGIMGRESAYSGRVITWEEALNSKQDFTLEEYDFYRPHPVAPVPMPGTYEFV